jgi:NAD-dependent deacetylase
MEIPIKLLETLAIADSIAVLTGAGISAESGIKTFRDPDGLWSKLNPQELASINGFMANPQLVWSWYQERLKIIESTNPNPGHYALAEMETLFPEFELITQNVDRLHHKAGSKIVWELHGNIVENHCQQCKAKYEGDTNTIDKELPECPICGGMIRPSVVWFGELLPVEAITAAEEAARKCDIFFSIGTSAEVYPAANLPFIAKQSGAVLVEVNPNNTALTNYVDFKLDAASGECLPILIDEYKKFIGENK